MPESSQLEEILSWRFVTELWRRFPDLFTLIEAHPGGGQHDSLMLVTKGEDPQFAIDVNRGGGSVHINKDAFGLGNEEALYSDWLSRMLEQPPTKFLDSICKEARLVPPKKLQTSSPTTITYRFIADFLTHSIGKLERWECRNGFEDTSGYMGGGKRQYLFNRFPILRKEQNLRKAEPFIGEYAYNYWFLLRNDEPVLCLDTSGVAYCLDGTFHDLSNLYGVHRKIWPLIFEVARDLLP